MGLVAWINARFCKTLCRLRISMLVFSAAMHVSIILLLFGGGISPALDPLPPQPIPSPVPTPSPQPLPPSPVPRPPSHPIPPSPIPPPQPEPIPPTQPHPHLIKVMPSSFCST